jgi:hypothetical protein
MNDVIYDSRNFVCWNISFVFFSASYLTDPVTITNLKKIAFLNCRFIFRDLKVFDDYLF